MFKRIEPLHFKLLILVCLISIIPTFIVALMILDTTENFFIEQQKVEYMQEVNIIANNIVQEKYLTDENRAKYLNQYVLNRSSDYQYRLIIIDSKGVVISDSSELANDKIYISKEVISALNGETYINYYKDQNAIYVSTPINNGKSSELLGVVLIVGSVEKTSQLSLQIKDNINVSIVVMYVCILIFSYALLKALLSPLQKIMCVIEKMSKGKFENRIEIKPSNDFYQLAEAINEMATQIETIEKSRDQFVSNVSHELKTPLSSIKVLSDSLLIQEDVPKEMYVEFLEDIVSETDRLTNIVNDLLTLVKIDQSNAVLNIDNILIGDLVQKIIKRIRYIASGKNIEIYFKMEEDFTVEVDPIKIDLAITNLIDNAVKYTNENGKVTVEIMSDNMYVYIKVEDTGNGIEKEELSNIFKRFYRIDKTRDRETGGFGLGLSITYSILLLHNGDVKVTSELGVGSKFIVMIPLKYNKEIL